MALLKQILTTSGSREPDCRLVRRVSEHRDRGRFLADLVLKDRRVLAAATPLIVPGDAGVQAE
jgi:hypothetical protein